MTIVPVPASHLLFAYGTLLLATGIAEVDEAMRNAGVSLGRACAPGLLYDLGKYPGAVPMRSLASGAVPLASGARGMGASAEVSPWVLGRLFRLSDPDALFAVLDPYEGFDPARPEASEFVRAPAPVALAGSGDALDAQIYWYNFPVAGRTPISGGDYLAHRAAQCSPAQGRKA